MRKAAWIFTPALVLGLSACGDDGGRGTETEGATTSGTMTGTMGTTDDVTTTDDTTTTTTTSGEPTTAGPTSEPPTSTTTTTEPTTMTTEEPETTTTGGDELTCEAYCATYETACADFAEFDNEAACLAQCAQWPVGAANDVDGDSLGCRLYHVTVAGMGDANTHCPHASPNGAGVCVAADAPQCADYCASYLANCKDDLNAYVDEADCLDQCSHWYPGTGADVDGDTVGCREYHAGAALGDAMLHCPHAGPGGGGVCVAQ